MPLTTWLPARVAKQIGRAKHQYRVSGLPSQPSCFDNSATCRFNLVGSIRAADNTFDIMIFVFQNKNVDIASSDDAGALST